MGKGRASVPTGPLREAVRQAAPARGFRAHPPLELALRQWRSLVHRGPPREIGFADPRRADAVIFTDGYAPDPRKSEAGPSSVGATAFFRDLDKPSRSATWFPRPSLPSGSTEKRRLS